MLERVLNVLTKSLLTKLGIFVSKKKKKSKKGLMYGFNPVVPSNFNSMNCLTKMKRNEYKKVVVVFLGGGMFYL